MIRRTFFKLALGVLSFPFVADRSGPAWWEWLAHPKLARLKARGVKIEANRAYLLAHWGEVQVDIRSGLTRKGCEGGDYTWIRGTFRHPSVDSQAAALSSCLTKHWAKFPQFQEIVKRDIVHGLARLYADKGVILT